MPHLRAMKHSLDRMLYPELTLVAPHHRGRAMQRARDENFDLIEICGLVAAVAVVTYFTRYGLKEPTALDRVAAAVKKFLIALPLLVLFAGPFIVRRNRRGLRAFIDQLGSNL